MESSRTVVRRRAGGREAPGSERCKSNPILEIPLRKLLVSAACVGVLAAPASLAFAAENNQNDNKDGRDGAAQQRSGSQQDEQPVRIRGDASTPAFFELTTDEPIAQASQRLDRASNRVETRHDVMRQQRIERREAAEAAAAAAAAEEAAVPASPTTEAAPSGGATSPALESIAQCESGGDYSAVDPSGTYHGAYQFDQSTWESVGGTGSPSAASPAEQDMRAQMLLEQSGTSPWPVCGG